MTQDAAVTAAAEALVLHHVALTRSDLTIICDCGHDCDPCHWGDPWETHLAEAAVAAARPIIEAEVRERIAAEIGAMTLKLGMGVSLFDAARDQAARIARGQT